ncbi:unnamed protein product, partial [Cuscuta epithymum]
MELVVFQSQGVFETKNLRAADLRSKDLEEIRSSYGFPPSAQIRFPARGERVDWVSPGWLNFYQYPFEKLGVRFPFSELVKGFIARAQISPCQIMPQAWRLLRSLEYLIEKHNLQYSAEDLSFTYDLRTSGRGRFTLVTKAGADPIILGINSANDRGWITKFFFVEKASLGEHAQSFPDRLRVVG